jgi:hypothetical protein
LSLSKFSKTSNQNGLCGKMSLESCRLTKDKILVLLEPQSKKLDTGMPAESLMPVTLDSHNPVHGFSLLDILETGDHLEKYYVSDLHAITTIREAIMRRGAYLLLRSEMREIEMLEALQLLKRLCVKENRLDRMERKNGKFVPALQGKKKNVKDSRGIIQISGGPQTKKDMKQLETPCQSQLCDGLENKLKDKDNNSMEEKTCSTCNKSYKRDSGYKHRDGKCKDVSTGNTGIENVTENVTENISITSSLSLKEQVTAEIEKRLVIKRKEIEQELLKELGLNA